ncbi:MAG: hypothetical protein EVA80_06255 [Proteobacteria bacterium]|jgi:hypothetical protein|nr:MAG: hypothetical protein EVA80_06255 [Pseudomonadota bacterium]
MEISRVNRASKEDRKGASGRYCTTQKLLMIGQGSSEESKVGLAPAPQLSRRGRLSPVGPQLSSTTACQIRKGGLLDPPRTPYQESIQQNFIDLRAVRVPSSN